MWFLQKISLKEFTVFVQLEPGATERGVVVTKEQFVKKYYLYKP